MKFKTPRAIRYTFKAYERLKREQHIDTLFRIGKAYHFFPVKAISLLVERGTVTDSPAQTGFSVPKKKFKRSVDRHRIRRLMVESWRLNKHILYEIIPPEQQLHLFFIYTGTELPNLETVKKALAQCIEQLKKVVK